MAANIDSQGAKPEALIPRPVKVVVKVEGVGRVWACEAFKNPPRSNRNSLRFQCC